MIKVSEVLQEVSKRQSRVIGNDSFLCLRAQDKSPLNEIKMRGN